MVTAFLEADTTTIPQALVNTGIGMGTVFAVLILISFIIYLFKFIPRLLNREKKSEAVRVAATAPAAEKKEVRDVSVSAGSSSDDRQLIAVIAAAVAAQMTEETGIPVTADGLVIRSIKKRTISN